MKSIVIAVTTAFVCILGIEGVSAAPVLATLNVNNVNDPINHPYQESTYSNCGQDNCVLTFGTTAASETLVQHVSCSFEVQTGTVIYVALVFDQTTGNQNYLPVSSYGSASGSTNYVINENTQLFFAAGGQPDVNVATNGPISLLSCTISGYHS